jgi:hypothetical protein
MSCLSLICKKLLDYASNNLGEPRRGRAVRVKEGQNDKNFETPLSWTTLQQDLAGYQELTELSTLKW